MNSLTTLTKNPIVVDVETTINNSGNPFDVTNQLITIQIKTKTLTKVFTKENFSDILPFLNSASCLVGTNFKFDLNWLRKILNYIPTIPIWDLQLAEFLFSNQEWKYPDLETMCSNYNIPGKLKTIEEKYWNNNINTTEIPIEELIKYGLNDVEIEYKVFQEQIKRFKTTEKSKYNLFRLQCADLLTLQEMEYNGIYYDEYESIKKGTSLQQEIEQIENKLYNLIQYKFNYNSNDDISILLYGGIKKEPIKIPVGIYKTGNRIGEIKFKNDFNLVTFPQIVKPIPKSELKKIGFFATDMPTLLKLKATGKAKKIISLIIERSILEKIRGTYLLGIPKLREKMNWPPNILYSTLNQCVASTGRLSSTKPNQQNFADLAKFFCHSRY